MTVHNEYGEKIEVRKTDKGVVEIRHADIGPQWIKWNPIAAPGGMWVLAGHLLSDDEVRKIKEAIRCLP